MDEIKWGEMSAAQRSQWMIKSSVSGIGLTPAAPQQVAPPASTAAGRMEVLHPNSNGQRRGVRCTTDWRYGPSRNKQPLSAPSSSTPSINATEVICISDSESEEHDYLDLEADYRALNSELYRDLDVDAEPLEGAMASEQEPPAYEMSLRLSNVPEHRKLEIITDLSFYGTPFHDQAVGPNDFQILQLLGSGAFGRVFLVRKLTRSDVGALYAMKVLNKTDVVREWCTADHTRTERVAMQVVNRSPFIASLHYAFQSSSKLYLVMDFAIGGELFTHLIQQGPFDEARARFYIAELVLALEEVHRLGIVYRDIKLENILLDADGHVVLTDFGLSKFLTPANAYRANSFCGTMEYIAPEMIQSRQKGYDYAVDWWSLGVLTFEMLIGEPPFGSKLGNRQIVRRIQECQPLIPESIGPIAKDFLLRTLEKDPMYRLGGNDRGAREVKEHAFFHGINWSAVRAKLYAAPFKPTLTADDDVQNFSTEFTDQRPEDPECEAPTSSGQLFRGYTYVAPEHVGPLQWEAQCQVEYCNSGVRNIPPKPRGLELGSLVTSGAYGRCHIAVDGPTNMIFMAKVVPLSKFRVSEVDALISCALDSSGLRKHTNIATYYQTFRDKCDVWILTKFLCGEELTGPIFRNQLDEDACREIIRQIVQALRHVHSKKFIHGDLKPENVVFVGSKDLSVNLVDFGNACYNSTFQSWKDSPRYTVDYASPELLSDLHLVTYSPAVDVYSLGAMLYTMLVGHAPFRRDQADHVDHSFNAHVLLKMRIHLESFNQQSERWLSASSAFKQLVIWCLQRSPVDRPSLEEILASEWMSAAAISD
ncbi:chromosomal serine/threonine-protein kinase JIL-1-like [Drosophila pseudoobscura]|uniref:non-specific serine/threonine protein kinase n=1 Tax=Drosophila pseudoobscura pseudoobscura TaxID=46245 RepID=A0A6I8UZF4_DROPS|nr:chromosomal serine/threonine-protein kinase JIL-1 [Drosophila pseudoobscura]